MEHIFEHMEEQMVTGNSKCGFMESRICLTIQMAFSDKMTGFADEGRAEDVIYLNFSTGFNTVS